MQTLTKPLCRIKGDRRGVSNVIIVVLSLVILVIVASNVILWSYQMNQLDWEKMQESLEIVEVARINDSGSVEGTRFRFENNGPLTCHIVSIWVVNSTTHKRYESDVYVNTGELMNYTRLDIYLPSGSYFVKITTERGNTIVYTSP